MLKIKTINIKAFRGIPCKNMPLDEKSLLMIGENGTGKSSIVDAIEFFFTGTVSSLTGTGTGGITLKRHVPHKNFTEDDVKIELTFTNDELLTRTFNEAPENVTELNTYFNVTQNGKFILRRRELLKFIEVSPGDRFKAITDLMGITSLNDTEKQLNIAKNSLNKLFNEQNTNIKKKIHELSSILGKEIKSFDEALSTLNTLLEENNLPIIESLETISEHKGKMHRFTNQVGTLRDLEEIITKSKEISIKEDLNKRIDLFNTHISEFLSKNLESFLPLSNLLKASKEYLNNEMEIEFCPLCRNEVSRDYLLEQIEEQNKNLEDLNSTFSEIKKESSVLVAEINDMIKELSAIKSKGDLIDDLDNDILILLSSKIDLLNNFNEELKISTYIDINVQSTDFSKEIIEINDILTSIIENSRDLKSKIDLTDEEQKFLNFVEIVPDVRNKIEEIKKANDQLYALKYQLGLADKLYEKFSTIKSEKIQSIFDSIETDMQDFYSFLHQNEPHRNVKLKIQGKGTSAALEIESFGISGNPKAYASEGHLDTLGLCIFLAFVKKFNSGCSLIVLDDIVTTVDSVHREKICRLLFENFKEKQFIITTHDGLWYEQISQMLSPYSLDNKFLKCIIYDWNEDEGPFFKNHKFKWEIIPDRISSRDINCAGNETRQYYEWVLENICKSTRAPLPINDKGYSVGELVRPARHQIKALIKDEYSYNEISGAFKEIDKSMMGNLLSHNNRLSVSASINDVENFFNSVKKLHELVSCPHCKRFLTHDANSDRMICSKRCENPKILETNSL